MNFKKFGGVIFYSFVSFSTVGQIEVMPGTSMTIGSGTTVFLDNNSLDTFSIAAGTSTVNNGIIKLSPLTIITEQPGYPIKGNGFEQYVNYYNTSLSGLNPGGLGFILSSAIAPDSLNIRRYHKILFHGITSGIARSYEIKTGINSDLSATLILNYDSSELNGINANSLSLYQSFDNGLSWNEFSSNPYNYYVQSIPNVADSLYLLSLFPSGLITSSSESSLFESLIIYPNPAKETIYLKGKNIAQVILRDGLGHTIVTATSYDGNTVSLNIDHLPPAIYFLEIQIDNQILHKRFIKSIF